MFPFIQNIQNKQIQYEGTLLVVGAGGAGQNEIDWLLIAWIPLGVTKNFRN